MDRELYRRWREHPLRALLSKAAAGGHVHDDEVDDLNLPPQVRQATEEAVKRVRRALGEAPVGRQRVEAGRLADHLSSELVEALPDSHETRWQREERRAALGDPEAVAAVNARREGAEQIADRILRGGQ